jgi:hypothetical protein
MHTPKLKPSNVSLGKIISGQKECFCTSGQLFGSNTKQQTTTHQVMLKSTNILARKSRCGNWFIREATEIDLNPKNMNLKDGFSLSR